MITVIRLLALSSGLVFVLASSLLYETEDHVIQNKLDVLWIRLSDAEHAAMSKQARFLRAVADLTSRFFDSVFGTNLLSIRSAGVSACLSMASLGIVCSPGIYDLGFSDQTKTWLMPIILAFLLLAVVPIVLKERLRTFLKSLWAFSIVGLCLVAFVGMHNVGWFAGRGGNNPDPSGEATLDLVFLMLTITCDTLFIAITRMMIRRSAAYQSVPRILAGAIGTVVLAIVLLLGPSFVVLGTDGYNSIFREGNLIGTIEWQALLNATPMDAFLLSLAGSNVLDALVASVFFALFLLLLFHLFFWPALQRPVYALASRGILARRKFFLVMGVLLIGASAPKGALANLAEALKKLFETFASS